MLESSNIILLGLGSEILTDDGLGSKIVNLLKENPEFQGISCNTSLMGGLEILEFIKDFNHAVIIDAIKTGQNPIGTVLYFTSENYIETTHLSSIHDADFQTMLSFGHQLYYKMPEKIDIIAIEVLEIYEFSDTLSPELEEQFSTIVENIRKWIIQRFTIPKEEIF